MGSFAAIYNDPILRKIFIYLAALLIVFGLGIIVASIIMLLTRKTNDLKALWTKYLAWFIIIPVLAIPIFLGRSYFISVVLLLAIVCFWEFVKAVGLWKDKSFSLFGVLAIIMIFVPVYIDWYGLYTAMPIYCSLFVLAIPIFRGEFEGMIQKTCLTIIGILYFGWFFSHLAYLTNMQYGIGHIFFLFVLVELNDALAYICGKIFGRHKFSPKISPNKTWEGAIGAFILTIGLAFIFRFAIPEYQNWQILIIAPLISIGGTFGDLIISFIKRDLQIKDMGKVIPGHGGILDRFDSIIFAAPIFFHFTRFFFWTLFFKP
jgi:phosphatidate cytidylyltransferase